MVKKSLFAIVLMSTSVFAADLTSQYYQALLADDYMMKRYQEGLADPAKARDITSNDMSSIPCYNYPTNPECGGSYEVFSSVIKPKLAQKILQIKIKTREAVIQQMAERINRIHQVAESCQAGLDGLFANFNPSQCNQRITCSGEAAQELMALMRPNTFGAGESFDRPISDDEKVMDGIDLSRLYDPLYTNPGLQHVSGEAFTTSVSSYDNKTARRSISSIQLGIQDLPAAFLSVRDTSCRDVQELNRDGSIKSRKTECVLLASREKVLVQDFMYHDFSKKLKDVPQLPNSCIPNPTETFRRMQSEQRNAARVNTSDRNQRRETPNGPATEAAPTRANRR